MDRALLGPTKTGGARAVFLLHPIIEDTPEWRPGTTTGSREILDRLRNLQGEDLKPESFVFGGGGRPTQSWELHHAWRKVLRVAGVRYRAPEQLRHTFASTMLSRNAPLLYVQQ